MTATVPRLDLELEGLPWLIGPTEHRPAEKWVAEAHPVLLHLLELEDEDGEDAARLSTYVRRVLERVADTSGTALPYRLLRWEEVTARPLVASFGLSEPGDEDAYAEFLGAYEMRPVEPAVIEELGTPEGGARIRRALSYSQPDEHLFVELRYLIEPADTDVVVLLTAGSRDPADLVAVQDELDELATRMRVRS